MAQQFMQTLINLALLTNNQVKDGIELLPQKKEIKDTYDYIIVGAGPAGSVIANRLAADGTRSVLLLEAGGTGSDQPYRDIPFLNIPFLLNGSVDWSYAVVPQKKACQAHVDQRCYYAQGRALGGGSLINGQLYVRGNKQDFDEWCQMGASGWCWKDVFPYFLKSENMLQESKLENGCHSTGGEVPVTRPDYFTDAARAFVDSAPQFGYEEIDLNGPTQIGFSPSDTTTYKGERVSSAKAFLDPMKDKSNLDVISGALVTKVLIDTCYKDYKMAYGVEVFYDNESLEITATKEVILSGGAINTAKLLLLSGIGPKNDLNDLKIPVFQDLPVGENFHDRVFMGGLDFLIDKGVPDFRPSLVEALQLPLGASTYYLQYILTKTGPLSEVLAEAFGFIRSNISKDGRPDVELLFAPLTYISDKDYLGIDIMRIRREYWDEHYKPYKSYLSFLIAPIVLRPKSRGTVKLNSADPFDPPLIDPNFLDDENDIKTVVEGAKLALKIVKESPLLQGLGARPIPTAFPTCKQFELFSDEYFECLTRHMTGPEWHAQGTCRMGDVDDPRTVVDPELRVKGIGNLRVADSSIIPSTPTGHPMATCYMIGEMAADLILERKEEPIDPGMCGAGTP